MTIIINMYKDLFLCNRIDNVNHISELYMMRIIIDYNKINNTHGLLFIHLTMCS